MFSVNVNYRNVIQYQHRGLHGGVAECEGLWHGGEEEGRPGADPSKQSDIRIRHIQRYCIYVYGNDILCRQMLTQSNRF